MIPISRPRDAKNNHKVVAQSDKLSQRSTDGRVVLVAQWYAPEPVSVPVLTAHELAESGFEVKVLTGVPNLPDGKVHTPYKAWKRYDEILDGIPVLRAPLYPSHSASAIKRMANYLSWALSATIVGIDALRKADVNVVHCTPATAAIPAFVAYKLYGTPYVVIIQDLWPDTVTASGFLRSSGANKFASLVLDKLVRRLYGDAAQIAVISEGMRQTLLDRDFPGEKIKVLFNSVDEDVYAPLQRDLGVRNRLGVAEDAFLLVYAGNQGSAQNLEPLIRAVGELSDRGIELLLVGWGVEQQRLQELSEKLATDTIHFLGRVSPSEVRRIQSAADLCVVSLKDDPLFRITIPSKLQSLLSSARAILGLVAGEPARIIEEASAGFVAQPGDTEAIKKAILVAQKQTHQMLQTMGQSGRKFYLTEMSSNRRARLLWGLVDTARRLSGKNGRIGRK